MVVTARKINWNVLIENYPANGSSVRIPNPLPEGTLVPWSFFKNPDTAVRSAFLPGHPYYPAIVEGLFQEVLKLRYRTWADVGESFDNFSRYGVLASNVRKTIVQLHLQEYGVIRSWDELEFETKVQFLAELSKRSISGVLLCKELGL